MRRSRISGAISSQLSQRIKAGKVSRTGSAEIFQLPQPVLLFFFCLLVDEPGLKILDADECPADLSAFAHKDRLLCLFKLLKYFPEVVPYVERIDSFHAAPLVDIT